MVNDESPLDDPLLTTFGHLIEVSGRLQRTLGQVLEERESLPLGWLEVLLRLARSEDGQLAMGVLAAQIVLTTGGVTRLVDRMESAGYVERRPCPDDRRVLFAGITAAGTRKLESVAGLHAEGLHQAFAVLTAKEVVTFDRLLVKLKATTEL
ncbi:MarR family winged helix-turn-helix transcriptional regulator [Umezawaea tangerina]|uniref:DNA-binding MarR family transcriptional regulator n=1 Tax=Umezawaea tangerina TaxID=84725 RepID=A0A2T0T4Q8_9PSEU|nr:MarR family transcriptional regulator [Umezawaea tangerina]PRY40621.1 DNA-binding MarR family transcriptional regulator [Umezawaea tangerina]